MSKTAKLKPCPFCGGPAEIERRGTMRHSNIVACTHCGCRVESGDVFDQGAAWNRRHPSPSPETAPGEDDALRVWVAEIEEVLLTREELKRIADNGMRHGDFARLCETALALDAQVAALRKALEPFAIIAELVAVKHSGWDHDGFEFVANEDFALTMAPFRRARALLDKKGG